MRRTRYRIMRLKTPPASICRPRCSHIPPPFITKCVRGTYSGKIVSAGANGEVVQWQAFFFAPPPPFLGPPPALSTHNTTPTMGGAFDSGGNSHHRNRQRTFQENDRDYQSSGARLRRAGGTDPPPREEQPGPEADGVDMDYQTTLAREDDGEITLSGVVPRWHWESHREGGGDRGQGAAAGKSPEAFEVGEGVGVEAEAGTAAGERGGKVGGESSACCV